MNKFANGTRIGIAALVLSLTGCEEPQQIDSVSTRQELPFPVPITESPFEIIKLEYIPDEYDSNKMQTGVYLVMKDKYSRMINEGLCLLRLSLPDHPECELIFGGDAINPESKRRLHINVEGTLEDGFLAQIELKTPTGKKSLFYSGEMYSTSPQR